MGYWNFSLSQVLLLVWLLCCPGQRFSGLLFSMVKGRKGYIAVPACRGSLAEAEPASNQTTGSPI